MARERPRVGELLERHGWITREQLLRALRNQKVVGGKLGTCLLEIDAVSEESLLHALAEQQNTSAAGAEDLRGVPDVVLRLVPARVARRLTAVPFKASGTQARVAVLDATDLAALDELSFVTGRRVHLHVTSEARLFEALERYYGEPCSPRISKLIDRLNRNRYLWRPEGAQDAGSQEPGGLMPGPDAVSEPALVAAEFIPSFQSTEGLELPPIDLPGAAPPPPAPSVSEPLAVPRAPAPPAPRPTPARSPAEAPGRTSEAAPGTGAAAQAEPESALAPPSDDEVTGEIEVVAQVAPPSLEEAEARLHHPVDRDDVGATLLRFAAARGSQVMLFKVLRDEIAGWMCGDEIEPSKFSSFHLPRNRPSVFRGLLEGAPLHRGPLSQLRADAELLALRSASAAPTDSLLLPILVRERAVAVLYLEPVADVFPPEVVGDLQRLAAKAAIALELCVLRAKLARA